MIETRVIAGTMEEAKKVVEIITLALGVYDISFVKFTAEDVPSGKMITAVFGTEGE